MNRGIGQKIPFHNELANLRMQLLDISAYWRIRVLSSSPNADAMFSIAARFHVLIWVACTPYFFANSERVSSSRIASTATRALKSAEWFFRFFILDRLSLQSIHLNNWSEIPRPPLLYAYYKTSELRYQFDDLHPLVAHLDLAVLQ